MHIDEIDGVLAALARERPVFHSEADFQHSLAWTLQMREPDRRIRLEYRAPVDEVMHVDILVVEPAGRRIAIELKYWTRRLDVTTGDEAFALRNQGAHDISRYDFVKDIVRIERLISSDLADAGWVIAITNDAGYWNAATRGDTVDAAFRIGHGRVLQGELAWAAHAGAGTTRGRLQSHVLSGRYELAWKQYSEVADGPSGVFRYLAVPVIETNVRAEGYQVPRRPEPDAVDPRPRREVHTGKYSGLQEHLTSLAGPSTTISFSEVAALVGGLPASARNHRAWWANQSGGASPQARAWMAAGWRVAEVNLTAERVRFVSD